MQNDTQTERAVRRRKAILTLLHQRPQGTSEIIKALHREGLFFSDREEDPALVARQQQYQFRRDIRALRLHYEILFDPKTRQYSLLETPFGLSFSPKQTEAFALVLHTFQSSVLPHAQEIQELFAFLLSRLPEDQQTAILEQRRTLNIELPAKTDYSQLDPVTLNEVERAILRGQQLEFTYRSPRTGEAVRHVVEPQPLIHKNGHTYLHGWSIEFQNELHFRLDYILPGTAKMLSRRNAPSRPSRPTHLLRFHLTPILARNRVSNLFPGQEVEKHPDGSATVIARVHDLFEARQTLLRYGENCTIEAPPELLEWMRPVATHFQIYLTPKG